MDIARPDQARKRRHKRILYSVAGLGVLVLITIGLSRLKPAAPLVENPWPDTVKRGEMLRQVRGNGALVPEEVRWIPATTDGIIEDRKARAGDTVTANSIILVMSNPDVRQRDRKSVV